LIWFFGVIQGAAFKYVHPDFFCGVSAPELELLTLLGAKWGAAQGAGIEQPVTGRGHWLFGSGGVPQRRKISC